MDPLTIAALSQGIAGGAQLVEGLIGNAKAKKIAQSNRRPVYRIQAPIKDNQNLLENRASQGLTDEAANAYSTGIDRGLTSSIEAITRGGGSTNNIADLYDKYQSGYRNMTMLDEQMRANNVAALVNQNRELGGELDKEFQINEWGPYADKAQAAAALKKQGNDNIWKGVNAISSAYGNYAIGNTYGKEAGGVFPKPAPNTGGTAGPSPEQMLQLMQMWDGSSTTRRPAPTAEENAVAEVQDLFPGLMSGYNKISFESGNY